MNKTIQYHPKAKYIDCALSNCDYCNKCGWVKNRFTPNEKLENEILFNYQNL